MRTLSLLLVLAAIVLMGCEPAPQPIRYGEDICAHCRMTISDARFGSELVTTTGKTYPFDSIECLAAYVRDGNHTDETHSLWVTPYDAPETLVPLADAFVVHSPAVRSPMGGGLAAFGAETSEADALARFASARVLDWDAVLARADGAMPGTGGPRGEPASGAAPTSTH